MFYIFPERWLRFEVKSLLVSDTGSALRTGKANRLPETKHSDVYRSAVSGTISFGRFELDGELTNVAIELVINPIHLTVTGGTAFPYHDTSPC